MSDKSFKCPHCSEEIDLTEAMAKEAESMAADKMRELNKKEQKLKEQHQLLKSKEESLAEAAKQELEKMKPALEEQLKEKLQQENIVETENLKNQLKELENKNSVSVEKELELMKQLRTAEEKAKETDLLIERARDEATKAARAQAEKDIAKDYEQQALEKDKVNADLRREIASLKRKAEQGSQQNQGEVNELILEEKISNAFPKDQIEPVPTGYNGADLIQTIRTVSGKDCGIILWELKKAKNWSNNWVDKLKKDAVACGADVSILVTDCLPKGERQFCLINGVWVVTPDLILLIASSLRKGILDVAARELVVSSQNQTADLLYQHITSPAFKNRIENFARSFIKQRSDIDKERQSALRTFKKREKQIESMTVDISEMIGEFQGVIGGDQLKIPSLELDHEGDDEAKVGNG